jgi:broad specificity phosphatase PhoE
VRHVHIVTVALPCVGVSVSRLISSLLVIRHGQSLWNVDERWQGRANIALSELGVRQAYAAADALGAFDLIASSQLDRARDTAGIIAERLGIGPVVVDERIQETDIGPWEGLTRPEIESRWPGYMESFRKPEGFESDESVIDRMTAGLVDIGLRCRGGMGLVISHSGVIRTMRRAMNASNPRLPNLGGCWFHVREDETLLVGDLVTVLGDAASTESL